jgi:hypothetical protein
VARGGWRKARSVARPEGLEPSTYGLEVRCSIQLSYGRPAPRRTRDTRALPLQTSHIPNAAAPNPEQLLSASGPSATGSEAKYGPESNRYTSYIPYHITCNWRSGCFSAYFACSHWSSRPALRNRSAAAGRSSWRLMRWRSCSICWRCTEVWKSRCVSDAEVSTSRALSVSPAFT